MGAVGGTPWVCIITSVGGGSVTGNNVQCGWLSCEMEDYGAIEKYSYS